MKQHESNQKFNDTWFRDFLIIILLAPILSGFFYLYQENTSFGLIEGNVFRASRMLIIYVIPTLIFARRHAIPFKNLGFRFDKPKLNLLVSLIGGIVLYYIAGLVFVKDNIFFGGWSSVSEIDAWTSLGLIGIMAGVTDYWTRGFILLSLTRKYNYYVGITVQNLTWFIIHIYEIVLLIPFIGLTGAILLTLFLGIVGDIIALESENIIGLIFGHILLNMMVMLTARGVVNFVFF